jgi:branched-chain amino acid transport system substrate-binding protein
MRRFLALVIAAGLLAACGTRVDDSSVEARAAARRAAGLPAADGTSTDAGGTGDALADEQGGAVGATGTGTGTATGAAAGAAGAAGTGARGGGAVKAASGTPIVLGAVGTRSGIIGAALDNSWRGLDVWEAWINANGGLKGHPVDVIAVDDGADPGKHAAAVRQLILERHVQAFVGNVAPLTFSAGVPLLEQYGIPALGGDSADSGWFTSPMAFPISGATLSRAIPIAKWAIGHLPQRKVATFYVNEAAAPKRVASTFETEWKRLGGEVVGSSGVSLAQPDYTSEVLQAKSRGAEIVYLVLESAACNRFFDAARRQQYKPLFFTTACTIENAQANRDLLTNHMYVAGSFRPVKSGNSPAQQEVKAAVARYDRTLEPDGAFLFTWLAGKLLEATGGTTTAEILAGLHRLQNVTLAGLMAPQTWPPGPHPESTCGMVSSYPGGDQFDLQTPDFVC